MSEQPNKPTKKCHNCRRQRLRCDFSYPHCNKCVLAGKECLGYGQLFRWTGAVASRGRLAGKTSSALLVSQPPDTTTTNKQETSRQGNPTTDASGSPESLASSSSSSSSSSSPSSPSQSQSPLHLPSSPQSKETDLSSDSHDQLIPYTPEREYTPLSHPWVLADPLFQDLSHPYRHYLAYFTNRLCKDLVAHDVPDRNPFRSLIPLTRANPLLQHIIVAASAAHMSNLCRPLALSSSNPSSSSSSSSKDEITTYPSGGGEVSRRALQDALVAKHKALRLMHAAVQNIDSVGADVVLAAALFFINVELIESGKHGWRAHMEGAGRIMSILKPTMDAHAHSSSWDLRDYLLSDTLSYFVLASAFMPTALSASASFDSEQIPLALERAGANSYQCCPPQIMEILYAASQLSNVEIVNEASALKVTTDGMELLNRAQTFDIGTWAVDALKIDYLHDIPLESRMNTGSAHRLAACIYIVQAIEPVGRAVGPEAIAALDAAMFDQLCQIPPEDANFKATTWPTFIYAAGVTMPESRAWVMERLQKLVLTCPWGFIYTAMETLQIIWRLDLNGRSWVQTLKDPALNFLIV